MNMVKDWDRKYAVLDQKGVKNPISQLVESCEADSLFEQRRKLFEIFCVFICNEEFQDYDQGERNNFFWLQKVFQEILESSYRIVELLEDKKMTYTYKE